jgi:DNA-binding sugar fermentation-stimulating protein
MNITMHTLLIVTKNEHILRKLLIQSSHFTEWQNYSEATHKKEYNNTEIDYSTQGSGKTNLGIEFEKWPESKRPHGPMPDMKLSMLEFWEHSQM